MGIAQKVEIGILVLFTTAALLYSAGLADFGLADVLALVFAMVVFANASVEGERTSGEKSVAWSFRRLWALLLLGDTVIGEFLGLSGPYYAGFTVFLISISAFVELVGHFTTLGAMQQSRQ